VILLEENCRSKESQALRLPKKLSELEFDTATEGVIVSGPIKNQQDLFFVFESIWVPQEDGENRETGENPVRSRHCDEALLATVR